MKNHSSNLNRALLLALQETIRNRGSYLVMVSVALVCGVAAIPLSAVTFGPDGPSEGAFSAFLLDIIFFFVFSILARYGAWTTRGRAKFASEGHLAFLMRLPLTVRELVFGRVLNVLSGVALVSLPIICLPYLFSEPFRAQFESFRYLFFVAFWVGFVFVFESIGLFTELGLGGRAGVLIYTAFGTLSGGYVGWSAGQDTGPVTDVVGLVQQHGPFFGLPVLLLGILALALSGWFTARRLRKRELTP